MLLNYENKEGYIFEVEATLTSYHFEAEQIDGNNTVCFESYVMKVEEIPEGENVREIEAYLWKWYDEELIEEFKASELWRLHNMNYYHYN